MVELLLEVAEIGLLHILVVSTFNISLYIQNPSSATRLVKVDKTISRSIVSLDITFSLQFRKNSLGKLLAQFDTPLVVRVDIPNGSLHVNLVLVHCNKRTQVEWSQFLEHDRVGGTVTLKHLVLHQWLVDVGSHFGTDFVVALAHHQGFSLREKVREENLVVDTARNWVVSFNGCQKVTWNDLGSLVDELVEGVLAVSSRLSPDDGTGRVVNALSVTSDILAVGFHISLLEIGSEAVHVLIIRKNGVGLSTVEVVVPYSDQRKNDGQVLLQRRLAKVTVHRVTTGQHLFIVVKADIHSNRETNGRPKRVTTTNPVPEAEHVLDINSEFRHGLLVSGQGDKVLGDVLLFLGSLQEPVLGRCGIGDSLLGGEGLGSDNEHGGLRADFEQNLGQMSSVNV
eukprot:Partr_v1_DN28534_c0_g1_i1_m73882